MIPLCLPRLMFCYTPFETWPSWPLSFSYLFSLIFEHVFPSAQDIASLCPQLTLLVLSLNITFLKKASLIAPIG